MAAALDSENGVVGANLALRTLDAVDPLIEVSSITTVDTVLGKLQRGEDPTLKELRALREAYGQGELESAPADAQTA